MTLLLEEKEIPNVYISEERMNFLGYTELEEVIFDVFEIKTEQFECLKEKVSIWKDLPVIKLDIILDNKVYNNVPFALVKNGKTSINPSLLEPTFNIIEKNVITKEVKRKESKLLKEQIFTSKPPEPPSKKDFKKEMEDYIKNEASDGFINDLIQSKFHSILDNNPNDAKVARFFDTYTEGFKKQMIEISEKIARREGLRAMESGGGTNSVQYANGGMMQGDLVITGNLSAGNLLGHRQRFIIGDGINSIYDISHNFGSLDVISQVYDNTTNEVVYPHVRNIDALTTRLTFPSIIPLNNYRVVILY